jgi:hypothetical protein
MTVDLAWSNSERLPTFAIPAKQFLHKFPVRMIGPSNAAEISICR